MSKVSTEVIRRVYFDAEGVYIEIGPDFDGLGLAEMRTVGVPSEEYFGKLRLTVAPEFALALADALALCAKEMGGGK